MAFYIFRAINSLKLIRKYILYLTYCFPYQLVQNWMFFSTDEIQWQPPFVGGRRGQQQFAMRDSAWPTADRRRGGAKPKNPPLPWAKISAYLYLIMYYITFAHLSGRSEEGADRGSVGLWLTRIRLGSGRLEADHRPYAILLPSFVRSAPGEFGAQFRAIFFFGLMLDSENVFL